jgi:primosomal protein N' (replication factor Y)
VVVQTTLPTHPAICFAAEHDYEGFARRELEDRRQHGYPPWRRLLRVLVRGPDVRTVEERATHTAERLRDALPTTVDVLGPAEPTVPRVQGLWRRHVLVKAPGPREIGQALGIIREAKRPAGQVEELWDVDPIGVL